MVGSWSLSMIQIKNRNYKWLNSSWNQKTMIPIFKTEWYLATFKVKYLSGRLYSCTELPIGYDLIHYLYS